MAHNPSRREEDRREEERKGLEETYRRWGGTDGRELVVNETSHFFRVRNKGTTDLYALHASLGNMGGYQ